MIAPIPPLAGGEVHLWHIDLAAGDAARAEARLVPAERARAARLRFARDRDRFVRARAAMRTLLGGYLGLAPCDVPLATGVHGKPFVESAGAPRFNLSHAGGRAVLAIGRCGRIGVDLESCEGREGLRELAASCLTPEESRALATLGEGAWERAFLTAWTRKEAVLKAAGTGLLEDPSRLAVGVGDARVRVVREDGEFAVESVPAAPGFICALAVDGPWPRVSAFEAGAGD